MAPSVAAAGTTPKAAVAPPGGLSAVLAGALRPACTCSTQFAASHGSATSSGTSAVSPGRQTLPSWHPETIRAQELSCECCYAVRSYPCDSRLVWLLRTVTNGLVACRAGIKFDPSRDHHPSMLTSTAAP